MTVSNNIIVNGSFQYHAFNNIQYEKKQAGIFMVYILGKKNSITNAS
ncbi:protein of unknown function [Candidatus Nitrosotalea okcheonensis]|uniref:Uncharacterized protein n=1 Tax=Candidatus Nitrosotalea okcheonensis TaxID=1903276 RepID=A0A2H1FCZ8_9ARCH|nr:protein of unknown function [Candidatus Nitrosotalea okcheonensis]